MDNNNYDEKLFEIENNNIDEEVRLEAIVDLVDKKKTDTVVLNEEDSIALQEREEELKRSLNNLSNLLDVTLDNLTILQKTKNTFMEFQDEIKEKFNKFELDEFKMFSDDLLERKINDEYNATENIKRDIYGINFNNITFEDYDFYLTKFEEYFNLLDSDNEAINSLIKQLNMQKEYLEDSLFDGIRNKLCDLVRKMTVDNLERQLGKYTVKDNFIDKIFKRDKLRQEIRNNINLKIKMAFNLNLLIEVYTVEDIAKYIKNLSSTTIEIEKFAKVIEEIYGISCLKRRKNESLITEKDIYTIKYFGNKDEFIRIAKENARMKNELNKSINEKTESYSGYLDEIKSSIVSLKMPKALDTELEIKF